MSPVHMAQEEEEDVLTVVQVRYAITSKLRAVFAPTLTPFLCLSLFVPFLMCVHA